MDVGVYDDSIVPLEPAAEEDVGGFACDSREGEEFVHFRWDFASEIDNDLLCSANDRFGFIAEESGRADVRLEFFRLKRGKVLNRGIFFE